MDPRDSKPKYDLEKIDFEWVKSTDSVKELKKALRALQDDKGGYFELEKAIEEKILLLDPASKKPTNQLSPQEMKSLEQDLENWSNKIESKEQLLKQEENQEIVVNEALSQKAKEAGNDYMRAKDYEQAYESYTKSINLNPRNSQSFFNRALVLLKQFKYKKAAEDCDKAILLNPDYTKAYHRRAIAFMELKEFEKALEDWKKVLEKDPENEEANEKLKKCKDELSSITGYRRIQITEAEDESDQSDESEKEEEKEKEKTPDPALQSIINLQDQEECLKEIEKIKLEGNAFYRKEDYDQALTAFSKAIFSLEQRFNEQHILTNPPVLSLVLALYNNRALAYSKLDLNLEAINDSKKVLHLDNTNSKALFRIGKCQANRNNLEAAKLAFNQLLTVEPTNEAAKKELSELEKKYKESLSQPPSSPKRSSLKKDEKISQIERRVSFRDEDLSAAEHRSSSKNKEQFKKAEAAYPAPQIIHDEEEEQKETTTKGVEISKETIENAKGFARKLIVFEPPKNALMFESAAGSLKNDIESFFDYIRKVSPDDVRNFFEKNEFSVELLNQCVEACAACELDAEWATGFFRSITTTCRFSTTIKLLSKSEKIVSENRFGRVAALI